MIKNIKKWSFILSVFLPSMLFAEQHDGEEEKNILDVLTERTQAINESLKNYDVNNIKEVFNGNDNDKHVRNEPIRDPFNLSDKMGMQAPGSTGGPTSFLPNFDQKKIPKLKLKGVVNTDANSPEDLLALLEINNKEVYMVKVGDELSYDPANPSAAMKIVTISRLSVTVQVGSLGNVLIVR